MAVITKDLVITTKDSQGNTIVYNPYTNIDNVEGGVVSVNGITPNSSGDIELNADNISDLGGYIVNMPEMSYYANKNTNNKFTMLNTFILTENEITNNLYGQSADVIIYDMYFDNYETINISQCFSNAHKSTVKCCVIILTGSGSPIITWEGCKLCCEAPTKDRNKTTIVTCLLTDIEAYLVSYVKEV